MGILIVFFTIIGGITLSAQSAINGTFSRVAGTIETTLLTFVSGSMFLALIILFFGEGDLSLLFSVPTWQLSAVFLGSIFLLFNVFAVPKIGVIATSITVIIGQLVVSVVIDHFGWFNSLLIPLDLKRMAALVFMMLALYFIFKGNVKSSNNKIKEKEVGT